jgi:hypothetical protein
MGGMKERKRKERLEGKGRGEKKEKGSRVVGSQWERREGNGKGK